MNFVEIAAAAIEGDPTATDMEQLCRSAVAGKMREARRFLTAEEIMDITEDTVNEETAIDPEAIIEELGQLEVTDIEWESVPEENKVEVELEGEIIEGCVVAGKFHRAKLRPDTSIARYSQRIAASMDEQAHYATTFGVAPRALFNPVPDVTMPCPKCSSRNVTPVWYDSGEVIACCNECAHEFDASIEDVAKATLAERTVEDVDILPEFGVFGSVWYGDDGKFGYEVYASGDLVEQGDSDTFEWVQEHFDDIADAYDEISEGTSVDLPNGSTEVVLDIDDDRIEFESGKTASRARIARMVSEKKAFLDNSETEEEFEEGAIYEASNGSQFLVESVKASQLKCEVWEPIADGRIAHRQVTLTPKQLRGLLG